ncbi:hypothetical protein ACOMHN_040211 [Nucella lapillus]
MVSVADEGRRLVLMGVDATYCVVDEVDTTTTTIQDHFLHEAIEDAHHTSVKQEPAGEDSEHEDSPHEDSPHDSSNQTDSKDGLTLSQVGTLHVQTEPTLLLTPHHNVKTEVVEEEGEASDADRSLSNISVLRAVLQREPVSLREPEKAAPPSSHPPPPQNVELIDSATGKALAGPVLKRKAKRSNNNATPPKPSSSAASGPSTPPKEGEGGGEKEEGEEGSKKKRSRDKPYQCGVCLRWFGCKSHVVEHMRTHTGEKPFECPICHRRFSQKSNIHQHMNTHTMQRPFRCGDCGKDFMYRGSLYKHKRLHTGERPYTCGECKRRFTHASQLFEHMRTHTNERPFQCGVCGRAFSHSGTMHRHQRGHFSQGRAKLDRGRKEGAGGVVSDINHNSPSYPSRMGTLSVMTHGSNRHVGESNRGSSKVVSVATGGSASSLSPWFVSDVHGKGGVISAPVLGKRTPGQPGGEGAPAGGGMAGETSNAPGLSKTQAGKAPRGAGGISILRSDILTRPGVGVVKSVRAPVSLLNRRASSSSPSPSLVGVGKVATSSPPLPQQPYAVPVTSSEALSTLAVLSAIQSEKREGGASVVAMQVQTPSRSKKTVTLLLTSPLGPIKTSDLPTTTTTTTAILTPPPLPSKRRSPLWLGDGQKKKRTRLETPDLKVFSCDLCGHSFCHRRSVKRHKLACHPEWDPQEEEGNAAGNIIGEGSYLAAGNIGEGSADAGNRDQVKMKTVGSQVNTTLLKSLLTLTAKGKPSSPPSPSFSSSLKSAETGSAKGEAATSLQAIADLCGKGQAQDINQNIVMALEKGVKDSPASKKTSSSKYAGKNESEAAVNQNLSQDEGEGGGTAPSRHHSMPKISLKGSRSGPTTTSHCNQNTGRKSCSPSGNHITEGSAGKMAGALSAEENYSSSSLQVKGSSLIDICDTVVVKLEPVDDAESS